MLIWVTVKPVTHILLYLGRRCSKEKTLSNEDTDQLLLCFIVKEYY